MVSLAGDRQANARLLDAVISVSRHLRLRDVLQRIVGYACELVDARFGALAVAGSDDSVADIVYHGVDDKRQSPLGTLHIQRKATRTDGRISVPMFVRGEVFANLYVTEKLDGGVFTADDQDTVMSLAAAAVFAVDNARIYELSRQRERWLQASNEITEALLAEGHPTSDLQLITERARAVAGAPVAAIALPHEEDPGKLVFKVVDGLGWANEGLVGLTIDIASTASGMVYSTGEPLVVESYGESAASWQDEHNGGAPPILREFGAAAIVPLAAGEEILGVLLLGKKRGERPFGKPDVELLRNFGAHAALALRYAQARSDQHRLAVFEDRERIAGDMQDLVIRRLFDIGLGLQGVSRLVQPAVRGRISGLVDELDATIRDLRHSIFSLQNTGAEGLGQGGLHEALVRIIGQATDTLGFEPRATLPGSLDSVVPEPVRPDLLATVREALANVARHARATTVSVELRAADGVLSLDVLDDGIGIPAVRERSSGLTNLSKRAERWGGQLAIEPGGGGGTRLTWTVPLTEL